MHLSAAQLKFLQVVADERGSKMGGWGGSGGGGAQKRGCLRGRARELAKALLMQTCAVQVQLRIKPSARPQGLSTKPGCVATFLRRLHTMNCNMSEGTSSYRQALNLRSWQLQSG